MTICERFDVVAVPFPFSDIPRVKRRKALVLSARPFKLRNGSSLLMMITSAAHRKWFPDVNLEKWREAGLQKPCVARMKLFSRTGSLSAADRRSVVAALREALPQHA